MQVWGARVPAIVIYKVISPTVVILYLVNEDNTVLVFLMLRSSFRSLIKDKLTRVAWLPVSIRHVTGNDSAKHLTNTVC